MNTGDELSNGELDKKNHLDAFKSAKKEARSIQEQLVVHWTVSDRPSRMICSDDIKRILVFPKQTKYLSENSKYSCSSVTRSNCDKSQGYRGQIRLVTLSKLLLF